MGLTLSSRFLEGRLSTTAPIEHTSTVVEEDHAFLTIDGEPYRRNTLYRRVLDHRTGRCLRQELIKKNLVRVTSPPPRAESSRSTLGTASVDAGPGDQR